MNKQQQAEQFAEDHKKECDYHSDRSIMEMSFKRGWEAAEKEQDEMMIKFAYWAMCLDLEFYDNTKDGDVFIDSSGVYWTCQELLNAFKEQIKYQ